MLYELALDAERFSSETHTVVLKCDPALSVNCNPTLLELALCAQVDNALKYTPASRVINLRGEVDAQTTLIEVQHFGDCSGGCRRTDGHPGELARPIWCWGW